MYGMVTVPANYQTECLSIFLIPKGIYYKELIHMIIEEEESHDVQSINWKTSGADGLGQIEPEVLRTREAAKEGVMMVKVPIEPGKWIV